MVKTGISIKSKEGEIFILRDKLNVFCKTAALAGGWDKKALTKVLLSMKGKVKNRNNEMEEVDLVDGPRASEICRFVFPENLANRQALAEMIEINSKAGHRDRIGKEVQLALSRSKEPLTLQAAIDKVAEASKLKDGGKGRSPAGKTDQVQHSGQPKADTSKSVQDQNDEVMALITVAAKLSKEYGNNAVDFDGTIAEWSARYAEEIFGPAEEAEDEDTEAEDTEAE
jgi:hypothetical protein